MKVTPLRGRVAVRELLPETIGRIVVPAGYHKEHERDRTSHRGEVLAVGAPARTKAGVEVAPEFAVGDVVLFVFALDGCEKFRAGVWPEDGKPVTWIGQEEVIAVEVAS